MEFTHTFTVSDEQVEELKLLQKAMQNYSIENGDTKEEAKEYYTLEKVFDFVMELGQNHTISDKIENVVLEKSFSRYPAMYFCLSKPLVSIFINEIFRPNKTIKSFHYQKIKGIYHQIKPELDELFKRNYLLKELESLNYSKDYDKFNYLYEEVFSKDNLSFPERLNRFISEIKDNYSNNFNELFEIIRLTYTKK